MDELKAAFPEEVKQATETAEMLQFKPEEVEQILALVGLTAGRWVARKMEVEEITGEEADRWAKCTRIVFWQYLQKAEAGVIVWVLLTVGLFAGKKSTKKPKPKGEVAV